MAFFDGADWIVVAGAVFAGAATVLGAWMTHRRPPASGPDDAAAPPATVRLHDDDRELILKVKDTLFRCVTRFEHASFDLGRHLAENSDQVRRSRPD